MDAATLIAVVSIFTAGLTIAIGSIGPALAEGRAASQALQAIAQQPDAANTITRTLTLETLEGTTGYWSTSSSTTTTPDDSWTVSISESERLTVVTANVREFSRVPGLGVENWLDA